MIPKKLSEIDIAEPVKKAWRTAMALRRLQAGGLEPLGKNPKESEDAILKYGEVLVEKETCGGCHFLLAIFLGTLLNNYLRLSKDKKSALELVQDFCNAHSAWHTNPKTTASPGSRTYQLTHLIYSVPPAEYKYADWQSYYDQDRAVDNEHLIEVPSVMEAMKQALLKDVVLGTVKSEVKGELQKRLYDYWLGKGTLTNKGATFAMKAVGILMSQAKIEETKEKIRHMQQVQAPGTKESQYRHEQALKKLDDQLEMETFDRDWGIASALTPFVPSWGKKVMGKFLKLTGEWEHACENEQQGLVRQIDLWVEHWWAEVELTRVIAGALLTRAWGVMLYANLDAWILDVIDVAKYDIGIRALQQCASNAEVRWNPDTGVDPKGPEVTWTAPPLYFTIHTLILPDVTEDEITSLELKDYDGKDEQTGEKKAASPPKTKYAIYVARGNHMTYYVTFSSYKIPSAYGPLKDSKINQQLRKAWNQWVQTKRDKKETIAGLPDTDFDDQCVKLIKQVMSDEPGYKKADPFPAGFQWKDIAPEKAENIERNVLIPLDATTQVFCDRIKGRQPNTRVPLAPFRRGPCSEDGKFMPDSAIAQLYQVAITYGQWCANFLDAALTDLNRNHSYLFPKKFLDKAVEGGALPQSLVEKYYALKGQPDAFYQAIWARKPKLSWDEAAHAIVAEPEREFETKND